MLVAWHNGLKRQSYSLKLSTLGIKANAQDVTKTLFAGQDAKVSVKGGYLHLSLPPKDAAAFVLR